ncbi:hypothetical protein P8631_20815, partial [Guyparkeria sp. 1SP6A2]|nr:hypothetical protein [Guyparkeria sp. 1SP6A2]
CERGAERPRARLGPEVQEVCEDGAGDLLIVVPDRLVSIREVALDAERPPQFDVLRPPNLTLIAWALNAINAPREKTGDQPIDIAG